MKFNFTKIFGAAILLATSIFSTSALAQSPYRHSNDQESYYNRQYNDYRSFYRHRQSISERLQSQKSRIFDGIRDGSLTSREATALRQRLSSLENRLALAARDGYMSRQQYFYFHNELDQMSRIIYNARHNYRNSNNDRNHYGYRDGYRDSYRNNDRRY